MPAWWACLLALAVNALCSLGMILQKMGIGWQTKGRERDMSWRRERRVWLIGFLLVFFAPFLNFVALHGVSPAVVGAMAGSSVAFTALFAAPILGVKLGTREIAASGVLFAGIVFFALFTGQEGSAAWSWPFFVLVWALPFAVAGIAWLQRRSGRARRGRQAEPGGGQSNRYGAVMGVVSGALGGLMIVVMKLYQVECGTDLLSYPRTPFLYAHVSVGIAGPYLMQVAYRHGSISVVAPALYGSQVVYPVVATWLVFSGSPEPAQIVSLAAIIGSVAVLALGPAEAQRAVGQVAGPPRSARGTPPPTGARPEVRRWRRHRVREEGGA